MKPIGFRSGISTTALVIFLGGCATYYQSNSEFNNVFERGDLNKALKTLREKPSEGAGKKQFLYFANNGLILSLLGKYAESNQYLEKAYTFGEDYRINYANEVASYLTNPNFTVYRGEDHEHLMLLYYKAINFLKMKKTDEALVECRRLNIRLQQLSDRYDSPEKYRRDAFVHTLMGIIYETDLDYNNAFIAYRNALDVYDSDYARLFSITAPPQLKQDLLRSAKLSGFDDEFEDYKLKLDMPNYEPDVSRTGGELIFFWHNGLSPVKTEWSLNFVISSHSGQIVFTNADMGMRYAFATSDYSSKEVRALTDMEIYRLTFPKYVERPPYFSSAQLSLGTEIYPVQLLEDVNKVAFKCLDERMNLELSKALIRVAIKKATEHQFRKDDKRLGAIIGMMNAITERADTRNWQTLPHSIYYTRIPLREGANEVTLQTTDYQGRKQDHTFTYEVKKGETHFHTFTSLESLMPSSGYY